MRCGIPVIDPSKLPELPPLPSVFATLPFVTKSYLLKSQGSRPDRIECELNCYRRSELVGDAVIYLYVTDWLIEQHDRVDTNIASIASVGAPDCSHLQY